MVKPLQQSIPINNLYWRPSMSTVFQEARRESYLITRAYTCDGDLTVVVTAESMGRPTITVKLGPDWAAAHVEFVKQCRMAQLQPPMAQPKCAIMNLAA